MSAISKLNSSRVQPNVGALGYNDLRDRVASLIRTEKNSSSPSLTAQPRPTQGEASPVSLLKADRSDAVGRELGTALNVLNRASSCFDLLTQKLDQVEGERTEMLAQLEEHKRAAVTWQGMIETVQARLRDAERDLAETRQEIVVQQERAGQAEERAAQLENALNQRDRRLGDVEDRYMSLHDHVMSAFGRGSQTHRTLEELVDRFHKVA